MRISDWSSDVCSSDLRRDHGKPRPAAADGLEPGRPGQGRAQADHHWRTRGADLIDRACNARRPEPAPAFAFCRSGGSRELLQLPWLPMRPASPSWRSEEHTSELQSLMRISYAV